VLGLLLAPKLALSSVRYWLNSTLILLCTKQNNLSREFLFRCRLWKYSPGDLDFLPQYWLQLAKQSFPEHFKKFDICQKKRVDSRSRTTLQRYRTMKKILWTEPVRNFWVYSILSRFLYEMLLSLVCRGLSQCLWMYLVLFVSLRRSNSSSSACS